MRRAKQFTGYEKRPNVMGIGFFAELFTHIGQWGTNVDSTAHFSKELVTVDQIDVNEIVLPLVVIDVHDEASKNLDLRAIARAREKRRNVESGTIAVWRNWRGQSRPHSCGVRRIHVSKMFFR
jgi:kynurenine formamidase